jgi:hypothetical protein
MLISQEQYNDNFFKIDSKISGKEFNTVIVLRSSFENPAVQQLFSPHASHVRDASEWSAYGPQLLIIIILGCIERDKAT